MESMINLDEMTFTKNNHMAHRFQDDAQDHQRYESQYKQISNQNVKQINFQ